MKYTSLIDNVKSLEWGLSIQEAYLFSWVYSLPSWADKVIIDTDVFYFGSKTKAIEDYPLLTTKADTVYRYYKSLEQKGLILIKKIDGKDYLALTEKSKTWGSKSEHSENNPRQVGKKSEQNSENNPTYNSISIISKLDDTNLKEISKEILASDLENEKLRLEIERLNQALEEKNKKDSSQGGAVPTSSDQRRPTPTAKFDFKQALINEGVEEEVANDFILVRKQKKAPATQTAFKLILNECETNQFPINEAIKICIAKNWLSFKYEWYLNLTKNDNSNNNANGYAAGGNKASNLSEKEGKSANRLVEIGKRPSISKLRQQNPFEVGQ